MSTYPFNPLGASGPNNIVGEVQSLLPTTATKYNYVVPRSGPFFLSGLVVSVVATASSIGAIALNQSVVLTPFVDYFPVFEFINATTNCAKGVYAGVMLVDRQLVGTITLSYINLGGNWVTDPNAAAALIAGQIVDPRITSYESAFNITSPFPAVTLPFQDQPRIGFPSVVASLNTLASYLQTTHPTDSPINFESHITNYQNPHGDTAATFNLGLVPNWLPASSAEALVGVATNRFVTPALAFTAIGSSSVQIPASANLFGIAKLNLGAQAGDGSDATKALTAAGLVALKTATAANAIKSFFAYERQILTFSLNPIPYPVLYQGTRCANWRDLIQAVQTVSGISPIQANFKLNCIYLPTDQTAPSMTITATV